MWKKGGGYRECSARLPGKYWNGRIGRRSSQIQSPLISKMLVQMETQARYKLEDQHQQPVERVAEGKIG